MRHAIFRLLIAALCIAFLVPLLFSFLSSSFSSSENPASPLVAATLHQLDELSQQLEDVNSLNKNYKAELSHLKRELEVFVVVQGDVDKSPTKSAIVSFLPHLSDHLDALVPAVHYSGRNRKEASYFVIGITTVKHQGKDHLIETLRSLVSGLSERDASDILIVVMVGESDEKYVNTVIDNIKENLESAVNSGLIEIISPKAYFYPDLTRIKSTFGDTPDRVQWRTKQLLDFSYLMMFCRSRGNFFMQLPDDISTKEGYLSDVRQFILDQRSNEWLILDFASDTPGLTGKLMRSMDLNALTEFFLMFHRDKPVDWLFEDFLSVKYCNPEKGPEDCSHEKDSARRKYRPALFNLIGVTAAPISGNNKKRPRLFVPHDNPPAIATTTMNQYQDFRIDLMYQGENYFWSLMPEVNDTVTIEFTPPVKLKQYYFRSGNADHIDDRFYDTVVEIKFDTDEDLSPAMFDSKEVKVVPGYDFVIVGSFDNNGIAEGLVPTAYPVNILRLRVLKHSEYWVALSEIKLTPDS